MKHLYMKRVSQVSLLATLSLLTLTVSIVESQIISSSITGQGMIRYPSPENYYTNWKNNYRVATNFTDYLSGDEFDFSSYFRNMKEKFIDIWNDVSYDVDYIQSRPDWSWTVPTYSPGENVGDLRSIADYVVWQDEEGRVWYNNTSTQTKYGDGNTFAEEIEGAIDACSASDSTKIVYVDNASRPYVIYEAIDVVPNLILSGDGWDTVIKLHSSLTWTSGKSLVKGYNDNNVILKDISFDGNQYSGDCDDTSIQGYAITNSENLTVLNVNMTRVRKHGIRPKNNYYTYVFNNYVYDCGWNGINPTMCINTSVTGNYVELFADVGISTWSAHYMYVLNNVVTNARGSRGYNNAAWGIANEPGSSSQWDSHHTILRNNQMYNITEGNTYGRVGICVGSEDLYNYKIIIDSNTVSGCVRGVKMFSQSYTDNDIFLYDNMLVDSLDEHWWVMRPDVWMTSTHASCIGGYISYEVQRQSDGFGSPKGAEYKIEVLSQSSLNLTFRLEGTDSSYYVDTSIVKVYHTEIDGSWKIDFHDGTEVNAIDYWDSQTKILSFTVGFSPTYRTIEVSKSAT